MGQELRELEERDDCPLEERSSLEYMMRRITGRAIVHCVVPTCTGFRGTVREF